MIFYTVLSSHRFHARLDDRQAYPAAAVFTGPCLIGLVELRPKMRKNIVGNLFSAVKHTDADNRFFPCYGDLNDLFAGRIVYRI